MVAIAVRICLYFIEKKVHHRQINKHFSQHITLFKQLYGPYGIRIANKAESAWHIKRNLSEVFTENETALKKAVESLEVLDTLFKAGLQPQGDDYLLHDLKLKYGKYRLEQNHMPANTEKTPSS